MNRRDSSPQQRLRPSTTIRISRADRAQISAIAAVHLAAFESFFLSSLGPRFLRTLYHAIRRDSTGLVLAATDAEGRVLGFAAGVEDSRGCFSRLARRHCMRFAWAMLPSLLRDPRIALRVLRSLRGSGGQGRATAGALLMSIAVDPSHAGQGIGGQLLESFLDQMARNGVQAACLTTDRDANEATNAFYQRHGFVLEHQFVTSEGRRMNQYGISTASRLWHQAA